MRDVSCLKRHIVALPQAASLGQKGQALTAGPAPKQCRIVLWVEDMKNRERTVACPSKCQRHLNGQSGSWRSTRGYQNLQRRTWLGSMVLPVEHDRQGSFERLHQLLQPGRELIRARGDWMFDANEYEVVSLQGLPFERIIRIRRFDMDKLMQGHRRR
jgi:hypothetical protein